MTAVIPAHERALLQLLRAGIYDDASALEGFPCLSASDWNQLYAQSKRQTVSGVLYHALSMLPDSLLPPYSLLLHWVARAHRIETAYVRMTAALRSLSDTFAHSGIVPVLEKGHAVARFYPRPELRVCGDIDLCFLNDDRQRADSLIAGRGISLRHAPDGSRRYEWDGIEVEHHSSLMRLHSPVRQAALSRILSESATTRVCVAPGLEATVLVPLAELLMINIHIMKHCIGSGIGLRHFCDYALAFRNLIPGIGFDKYQKACRDLGLTKWTDTLHRFINIYLGDSRSPMPAMRNRPVAGAVEKLYAMVIEGGNFGLFRHADTSDSHTSVWRRKFGTFSAFIRHSGISMRIAPAESLCLMMRLIRGQVH